jgi:PAT family beta-lactamase induction signal transducer AmpG
VLPALSESRALRLLLFTALYFAQGVPWGFVSVGYAVLLSDLDYDNAAIGAAVGLAYLPWAFKILWGPMLDAVPPLTIGRRRPFIVFGQAMMGLTLLALCLVDPETSIGTVTALLFFNNTFAALQDVASDALAVDLLQPDERGKANALMWAGKSGGVAAGGGAGTAIAGQYGWSTLFLMMAVFIWLVMLLPVLLRERPASETDQRPDSRLLGLAWFLLPFGVVGAAMYGLSELEGRLGDHPLAPLVSVAQPFVAVLGALLAWPLVDPAGFREMRASFSFSVPWWGVLANLLMPAGYAMVGSSHTRLMRADLGFTETDIAWLSGVVDPIAGVVGALCGGLLADWMGMRRAIGVLMGALAVTLAAFAEGRSWWGDFWDMAAWVAVFTALLNAYGAATLGLFMGMSNPRVAATQFAIFMATVNLTYAWTAPFGGAIADTFGYPALFVVAAAFQLGAIVLLLPLDVKRAEAAYRG